MQKENTSIDLISCGKTFKDGTRALEKINLNIKGGETVPSTHSSHQRVHHQAALQVCTY